MNQFMPESCGPSCRHENHHRSIDVRMVPAGSWGSQMHHVVALAAERLYLTHSRHSPAERDCSHEQHRVWVNRANQWTFWCPRDRYVCSSGYCRFEADRIFRGRGVETCHRTTIQYKDIAFKNGKRENNNKDRMSYVQNAQHNPESTHDSNVYPREYFAEYIPFRTLRTVT